MKRLGFALACVALARSAAADPLPPPFASPEPAPGHGDDSPHEHEHEHDAAPATVEIHHDRPGADTASRLTLGRRELELRPRARPADLVEAVPGLFAVQHAGGGKANQYFLRGFDADHGTDVAFLVDGVPVNLPSHAHGQGFADLHFLIPELVVGLDATKGTFDARHGDFATAGTVELHLAERFEESLAQASVGQYGVRRALVVASPDLGDAWRAVVAAEGFRDDGPFVNAERLERYNVFARATRDVGDAGKVSMTWMSYGSTWNGSGQLPARAVCGEGEAGNPAPATYGRSCIDRFGHVDPSEGGATQRHQVSLAYDAHSERADLHALVYALQHRFTLYSNFTFNADDPARGDEIEQVDDRTVLGGAFRVRRHWHWGDAKLTSTLGAQMRSDAIDGALWHDRLRQRLEARNAAHVGESSLAAYAEADARLTRFVRLVAGVRAQRMDVSVDDRLGSGGGVHGASKVLPKASLVVSPVAWLDLFASAGRGFHSNDARAAVLATAAAPLLTAATSYEAGVRAAPVSGLTASAAAFRIDLDSELVWSGDTGTTSAVGATRREGVELDVRYRLASWLFADADATFTRARYRENAGNGEAVALAPTRTLSAGVGARPTVGAFTPFGAVRVKSIGERPAVEDGALTAQGFTVVDANVGVRWKDVEGALDVQNVLDARWREVQFASDTRLPYEPAAVRGITFSPGWPRTVTARATFYFR